MMVTIIHEHSLTISPKLRMFKKCIKNHELVVEPPVICYIAIENCHIYIYIYIYWIYPAIQMVIFQFAMLVYQRVNLRFPMVFLWFSYGCPIKTIFDG